MALFRLGFRLFSEYVAQYTQAGKTWQDEIRLSIEAYMTFALENLELYQLCFERSVPGFVPSEKSMQYSFEVLQQAYERKFRGLSQKRSFGTAPLRKDRSI